MFGLLSCRIVVSCTIRIGLLSSEAEGAGNSYRYDPRCLNIVASREQSDLEIHCTREVYTGDIDASSRAFAIPINTVVLLLASLEGNLVPVVVEIGQRANDRSGSSDRLLRLLYSHCRPQ